MNNLKIKFNKELKEKLRVKLGIKNAMAVPKLSKIVVNMGVKDVIADKKNLEKGIEVLTLICGQKPRINKAKKSIAAFKLREGEQIAVMATLRGERMYDLFEKLTTVVFPRFRDFHGVSRDSFDGKGNYTLGFAEDTVFSEIDAGKIDKTRGFELTIVNTAKNKQEGLALLEILGMPFVKV